MHAQWTFKTVGQRIELVSEDLLSQAEKLASGTELVLLYEPSTILNALIRADLYDYVEKEAETCTFDSVQFERLLFSAIPTGEMGVYFPSMTGL